MMCILIDLVPTTSVAQPLNERVVAFKLALLKWTHTSVCLWICYEHKHMWQKCIFS